MEWEELTKTDLFNAMDPYYTSDTTMEDAEKLVLSVSMDHFSPLVGHDAVVTWLAHYDMQALAEEWLEFHTTAQEENSLDELYEKMNRYYRFDMKEEDAAKLARDLAGPNININWDEIGKAWIHSKVVEEMANADRMVFGAFALSHYAHMGEMSTQLFFDGIYALLWSWDASDIVRFYIAHPNTFKERYGTWSTFENRIKGFMPDFAEIPNPTPEKIRDYIMAVIKGCESVGGPENDRDPTILLYYPQKNEVVSTPSPQNSPRDEEKIPKKKRGRPKKNIPSPPSPPSSQNSSRETSPLSAGSPPPFEESSSFLSSILSPPSTPLPKKQRFRKKEKVLTPSLHVYVY